MPNNTDLDTNPRGVKILPKGGEPNQQGGEPPIAILCALYCSLLRILTMLREACRSSARSVSLISCSSRPFN